MSYVGAGFRRPFHCCQVNVPEYPRHLRTFDYVGRYAYFLTFCTFQKSRLVITAESVAIVHEQILLVCAAQGFQIKAFYCLARSPPPSTLGKRRNKGCGNGTVMNVC
jgi:hypothetical protein